MEVSRYIQKAHERRIRRLSRATRWGLGQEERGGLKVVCGRVFLEEEEEAAMTCYWRKIDKTSTGSRLIHPKFLCRPKLGNIVILRITVVWRKPFGEKNWLDLNLTSSNISQLGPTRIGQNQPLKQVYKTKALQDHHQSGRDLYQSFAQHLIFFNRIKPSCTANPAATKKGSPGYRCSISAGTPWLHSHRTAVNKHARKNANRAVIRGLKRSTVGWTCLNEQYARLWQIDAGSP